MLVQKDEDFQNHPFQPPQAISKENGKILVTLWVRQPSGMSRERTYQFLEYRFSKDGELAGTRMLDSLVL